MPLKTGKLPKQVDPRTLRYADFRSPGPWRAPAKYSYDAEHPGAVPLPMFLNDSLGDCVEAESGHFALRAEFEETGAVLPILDSEIKANYLSETGGADNGLVMLDHLKLWRSQGLVMGGKRHFIHSFVEVAPQDDQQVREAIIVGLGVDIGVALPLSAFDQLNLGQDWDLVAGPRGAAGSAGGHCVLVQGYDAAGVDIITWGQRVRASWRWIAAYCDEMYAVIDALDRASVTDNLDTAALDHALAHL